MKKCLFLILTILTCYCSAQEWIIIDILEQSRKELVYKIDNGKEVLRKTKKNPSIVKLIKDYQEKGYDVVSVTQGVELDLNGNLPLMNSANNNFGITNLMLSNNNRVMLWLKKNNPD